MIRNSSSPQKQMQYASKLKMIDNHIIKTDMNMNTVNLEYEQMLRVMAMKLALDPPQQILPFTPKTVIFDSAQTRTFLIRQQTAPKGKHFMLNVSTYVPVKLQVKINDRGSKFYNFQGDKAIQILQDSFAQINIAATIQKIGMFSSVKFYLDLVQAERASPKKVSVNLRPNIDKQLQEYLLNNRGKSAEILRNRSIMRNKQMMMRKTTSEFRPVKSIELVRSKSQIQHFQKKKSLYIKHVRKMSPSKVKILQENQQKYYSTKKQQMANLAIMVYIAKLGMVIHRSRVKQAARKLRQMKITMLCVDFIKIIKNKFRLKMTQKARLRMTTHHTMQFIPTIIRKTAIQNAKKTLLEIFTPYMDFRTIEELGANSVEYIASTIKIQKYFKKKSAILRQRIHIFVQILKKQQKIEISEPKMNQIIEQYVRVCKNKGRWTSKIYQQRQQLIKLMRKNATQ